MAPFLSLWLFAYSDQLFLCNNNFQLDLELKDFPSSLSEFMKMPLNSVRARRKIWIIDLVLSSYLTNRIDSTKIAPLYWPFPRPKFIFTTLVSASNSGVTLLDESTSADAEESFGQVSVISSAFSAIK